MTTYCKNVGMGDAEMLGRFALYAIMAFVILIALEQLGLGDIIRQTFLILVAAIGLGACACLRDRRRQARRRNARALVAAAAGRCCRSRDKGPTLR